MAPVSRRRQLRSDNREEVDYGSTTSATGAKLEAAAGTTSAQQQQQRAWRQRNSLSLNMSPLGADDDGTQRQAGARRESCAYEMGEHHCEHLNGVMHLDVDEIKTTNSSGKCARHSEQKPLQHQSRNKQQQSHIIKCQQASQATSGLCCSGCCCDFASSKSQSHLKSTFNCMASCHKSANFQQHNCITKTNKMIKCRPSSLQINNELKKKSAGKSTERSASDATQLKLVREEEVREESSMLFENKRREEERTSCSDSDRLKGDEEAAEISSLTSDNEEEEGAQHQKEISRRRAGKPRREHVKNRWSRARHSAGCTSSSLCSSSLNSLNSSSLNSLEMITTTAAAESNHHQRQARVQRDSNASSRPAAVSGAAPAPRFSQLTNCGDGWTAGSTSVLVMNDNLKASRYNKQQQQQRERKTTTSTELSRSCAGPLSQLAAGRATPKRRLAPLPPTTPLKTVTQPAATPTRRSQSVSDIQKQPQQLQDNNNNLDQRKQCQSDSKASTTAAELLSEQEVNAIEHFLKSHKSSVYVCGCMCNLYFTKTHLVDNGRASKAASSEWKLNKTGVPVLIFDSGLAKNRTKKRLSISLTERGSGFVLWSDTIDHLSNYRAFSPRLHSIDATTSAKGANDNKLRASSEGSTATGSSCNTGERQEREHDNKQNHQQDDTCDSFHVMYLSSNHRIMVGLSFDNALCAQLFLAQIELVCSDPANIALTGPKASSANAPGGAASAKRTGTGSSAPSKTALTTMDHKLVPPPTSGATFQRGRPASSGSGALVGKLFGLNKKKVGPSPKLKQTFRAVNQESTIATGGSGTGGSMSWSTLKRAAKRGLGGNCSESQARGGAAATTNQSATPKCDELGAVWEAFRPRPLAQLAAGGKLWQQADERSLRKKAPGRGAQDYLAAPGDKRVLWRSRQQLKRMPRKCDISAPCLFQHVRRVDLASLEHLYSKSLVLEQQQAAAAASAAAAALASESATDFEATDLRVRENGNNSSNYEHEEAMLRERAAEQESRVVLPQPEVISRSNSELHNNAGRLREECAHVERSGGGVQPLLDCLTKQTSTKGGENTKGSGGVGGVSLSSSSSCYSSGSASTFSSSGVGGDGAHSPASNDFSDRLTVMANSHRTSSNSSSNGAQCKQRLATAGLGRRSHGPPASAVPQRALVMVARPPVAPPKPPKRDPCAADYQHHHHHRRQLVVSVATSGVTDKLSAHSQGAPSRARINSILKELQAQVSSDLVDAKRRLMADITNRVTTTTTGDSLPGGGGGRHVHSRHSSQIRSEKGRTSTAATGFHQQHRQQQQQHCAATSELRAPLKTSISRL